MKFLWHDNQQWFLEKVCLELLADQFGTPCYVYSKQQLINNFLTFSKALADYPSRIHYAVKANSNLSILRLLQDLGAGFDIVSFGELSRLLAINSPAERILFSGAGKTIEELTAAVLSNIACINIESKQELLRLNNIALTNATRANISIRVNPDVDPKSHPHISTGLQGSKFGVQYNEVVTLYKLAQQLPGINIKGIGFHIGSQIISLDPFLKAIQKVLQIVDHLQNLNIKLEHINIGGGLGICYHGEKVPSIQSYITAVISAIKNYNLKLYVEPGRAIVADTGILLTKVEYIKPVNINKYYAIVDAGMNDFVRATLYNGWHQIIPLKYQLNPANIRIFDIVGPVCESSDVLGSNRELAIQEQDRLMICNAGAYGFSMSSNYNTRARPAEVMVDGDKFYTIRPREKLNDLFRLELI